MTLSVLTNWITGVVGSGATAQEVPFTFPITATTDLLVMTRVTATGAEATLTEGTDYTVDIDGIVGGTVTTVTAVAATKTIHVIRRTPATQEMDLTQGGSFSAETIETATDKAMKLAVEAHNDVQRCIRMAETDADTTGFILPDSIARADGFLAFDSAGMPTVVTGILPDDVIVGAFGETFIASGTAAAARTHLELGTAALLNVDTDGTLAANVDTRIATQKAVKTYVDTSAAAINAVLLTGNQTILTGIKTFVVSPVVPTPTTEYQASTKKYVDDKFSGLLSTDGTLADNSDAVAPTEQAVKTYADTKLSKTANDTAAGIITFTLSPKVPTPTAVNDAATKAYADTKLSKTVNDTAAGIITFTLSPKVPAPTAVDDAANKKYVDDHAGDEADLTVTPPIEATVTAKVVNVATTLSMPAATAEADGYLKKGDWTTFNNKQDAIVGANLTASGPISVTNTGGELLVASDISISHANGTGTDGYITSAEFVTFNNKQDALSAATAEADGYLDKDDWTTFNDKQDALPTADAAYMVYQRKADDSYGFDYVRAYTP